MQMKVNRVIERKLEGVDPAVLQNLASKSEHMSVMDFIERGIRALNANGKERLATTFWVAFYREFPTIRADAEIVLPEAPENLDTHGNLDRELLEGMAFARKKNPVERSPMPLVRFLDRFETKQAKKDEQN